MKCLKLLSFFAAAFITCNVTAQNVGIGTNTPQSKLHVAGGIRVDALAGGNGLVTKNSSGDFTSISLTGNSNHVLLGNGTFGTPVLNGIVPTSGLIASEIYNNTTLLAAGYSLIGELPSVIRYVTTNTTFPANTWQPTYTRGIAANQSPPTYSDLGDPPHAVWTGTLMYVWYQNSIYIYNPYTDLWQLLTSSAFTNANTGNKLIWTGTELIFWEGGILSGKKYNTATNTLTPISSTNAPSARRDYTMIWDGTQVIVWGGQTFGGTALNTGGFYNPVTDTWTTMSTAGTPSARAYHTAVWNTATSSMIIWGGSTSAFGGEMNTGGLFDPATNTWTGATSTTNAPSARKYHSAAWTGTEMIIIGGDFDAGALNTGGRYNPATNTWAATSTTGSPTVRNAALAWTGTQLYVSGGLNGGTGSSSLQRYDPALNTWALAAGFSKGKFQHHCFYIGNMLLVWGGDEMEFGTPYSNEGFRYFLSNTVSSATTLYSRTLYLYQKI